MRITTPALPLTEAGVHPGRGWFMVLSGTAELRLGERLVLVDAGNAAEFATMIPHSIGAHGSQPVEIVIVLTDDGHRAHTRELRSGPAHTT